MFIVHIWSPKSIFKICQKSRFFENKDLGWMLIWIININLWCYIWCWKQHSIIVAHFHQKCCISATNVVLSIQTSIFIWMNVQNPEKSTFVPKNKIFVGNEQQWCLYIIMLLPALNIGPCAFVDNIYQHPSTILRFSKNFDFWHILKIDFEHDLLNITNCQHIAEGASVATNRQQILYPLSHKATFICSAYCFHILIKPLICGNKSNNCCL